MPPPEISAMDWTMQMALADAHADCEGSNPPDKMVIVMGWNNSDLIRRIQCGFETNTDVARLLVQAMPTSE